MEFSLKQITELPPDGKNHLAYNINKTQKSAMPKKSGTESQSPSPRKPMLQPTGRPPVAKSDSTHASQINPLSYRAQTTRTTASSAASIRDVSMWSAARNASTAGAIAQNPARSSSTASTLTYKPYEAKAASQASMRASSAKSARSTWVSAKSVLPDVTAQAQTRTSNPDVSLNIAPIAPSNPLPKDLPIARSSSAHMVKKEVPATPRRAASVGAQPTPIKTPVRARNIESESLALQTVSTCTPAPFSPQRPVRQAEPERASLSTPEVARDLSSALQETPTTVLRINRGHTSNLNQNPTPEFGQTSTPPTVPRTGRGR